MSLALGRFTAAALLREPGPAVRRARTRVAKQLSDPSVPRGSRRWLEEWRRLLDDPLLTIVSALIVPSERGYELRQHTPFTGLLSEGERAEAIRQARRSRHATRPA